MRAAADTLKPVLLELGGKNALIIYPDADLDKAIAGAVRGMNFTWAGQSCGSTSRLFVHESIHDRVLERVVDTIRRQAQARHCRPTGRRRWAASSAARSSTRCLASSSRGGRGRAARHRRQAARTTRRWRDGYFVEPTVFADVTPAMRIAREEVFGPILSVFKWRDEDEMFAAVNGVEYGLTARSGRATSTPRTAPPGASRPAMCGSTTPACIFSVRRSAATRVRHRARGELRGAARVHADEERQRESRRVGARRAESRGHCFGTGRVRPALAMAMPSQHTFVGRPGAATILRSH